MSDPLSLDLSNRGLADFKPPQMEPYAALDVSNNPLENFAFLTKFPHLRTLRARNSNIFEFSQLPRSIFRTLNALDVPDNNLTSLTGLSDCEALETLDVSGNPLAANAERGLACALPRARYFGFRGTPVHGLLLAEKLAADALVGRLNSENPKSTKTYIGNFPVSGGRGSLPPALADSFDFGAARLSVSVERFPSDGRLVFSLRCESARGPLYEPLEVAAYAVSWGSVNRVAKVALFPRGSCTSGAFGSFGGVSGGFQGSRGFSGF